jgi:hypothetical protein
MVSVHPILYISHFSLFGLSVFHPSSLIWKQINDHNYTPLVIFISFTLLTFLFSALTIRNSQPQNISEFAPLNPTSNLFFCSHCHLHVPLRSKHCRKCEKCVLRRDHHCPFFGVCIGMDNHLYFMITFLFIIPCYSFGIWSLFYGFRDDLPVLEWLYLSMPCTLGGLVCSVLLLQPILLLPFHIYLMCSNRTTWEVLQGRSISYLATWYWRISPFSHGLIKNCCEFLCMHWNHPTYSVPQTEEELQKWKDDNCFCSNEYYEC